MTLLRSGATKEYSNNWASAFGGKKPSKDATGQGKGVAATAKKSTVSSTARKTKPAKTGKAKSKAKKK